MKPMSNRPPVFVFGLVVAAAALFLSASALGGSPGPMMRGDDGSAHSGASMDSATLLIRHQDAHVNTWSLNGGPFRAHQSVTLERGSTLAVIDNDVLPNRLVEVAGGTVKMRSGTTMPMRHMGAWTTVTFVSTGVYRFRGADSALTLPSENRGTTRGSASRCHPSLP
jgi:hypothetical protein